MCDISLLLLSLLFGKLLYYLCSFSGIQFSLQFLTCFFFGHCYCSIGSFVRFLVCTVLFFGHWYYCSIGSFVRFLVCTVLFFACIFLVCFERLFFGGYSTQGVSIPPYTSFSLYAPFTVVCPNLSLAVDTNISCILFQYNSIPISSSLLVTDAWYSALSLYFFNFHHLICLLMWCSRLFLPRCFIEYARTIIICCIAMLSTGITLDYVAVFMYVLSTRI